MTDKELIEFAKAQNIPLYINSGWYELVKDLIIELTEAGWNGKVSCIKEKYGSLRFYISQNDYYLEKIIDNYREKSLKICEICGKRGRLRYGGWMETLCVWHYRPFIIIWPNLGFTIHDYFFSWNDITDLYFEKEYKGIRVELKEGINLPSNTPFSDGKLYLHNSFPGWYKFVKSVPEGFKGFDYIFWSNLARSLRSCPCCGYIALIENECRCCGFTSRENEEDDYYKSEEYIKDEQLEWYSEVGDEVQEIVKDFEKGTKHKILYTEEEKNDFDLNYW